MLVKTLLLCGISLPLAAQLTVYGSQHPGHIYGNAETVEFRRAMQGAEPLTTAEEEEIRANLPEKDTNRWYFRLRASRSKVALKHIRNKGEAPFDVLKVIKTKISKDQTGLELAWGYAWQNVRLDIEYLINKNLEFSDDSVFGNTPPTISQVTIANLDFYGKFRHQVFFANLFYDFKEFVLMLPYVTAGVGMSRYKSVASVTNFPNITQSQIKRRMNVAWTVGLGVRYRLFSRMFLDVGYRFSSLGSPLFKNSNAIQISGKHYLSGFLCGINWLL